MTHADQERRTADALIAIRRIVRAAEFAARDVARAHGLTPSQMLVLQIVTKAGETGAGDIARAVRLSQGTVTTLLDKLEAAGVVVRRREESDRRRVTIVATEKGRHLAANAPTALQDVFTDRFSRLEDWEQSFVIAALQRVSTLLDADKIDASPVLDVGPLDRAV